MEEAEFLRAIVTRPADDTMRLVYADWLDENGDSDRAAFIRVQIELARLPEDDPRRAELAATEAELFEALRHERLPREYPARFGGRYREDYRRGFVYRLFSSADPTEWAEFCSAAPDLFARAPIQELWLGPSIQSQHGDDHSYAYYLRPAQIAELADLPELARLSRLQIDSPALDLDGIARALMANPHLRALQQLHFENRYPSEAALSGWAESDEYIDEPFNPATEGALVFAFGHRVSWVA